jgi:lactate dehydrogenase-like 2-hydroxyacid dehydrogenase
MVSIYIWLRRSNSSLKPAQESAISICLRLLAVRSRFAYSLPHRGYATVEVLRECFERALSNIVDFMEGKPLKLSNPEALSD